MNARAIIDPNIRVRTNQTFVGFEDCDGNVVEGDLIDVMEIETRARGLGRVTEIDFKRRLVYIAVRWSSLTVEPCAATFISRTKFRFGRV
jgi:hypothetical protein